MGSRLLVTSCQHTQHSLLFNSDNTAQGIFLKHRNFSSIYDLWSHKEATEGDIRHSIAREVCQEQVNLVIPAGVQEEDCADKVLVPGGVWRNVPGDGPCSLAILPEANIDVVNNK